METFREFVEKKPWKAHRKDVLQFWKSLKPNLPITIEPVPEHHTGTKFRFDGFRVTGRPEFINSVISRLKDVMDHETPGYKLEVEYRQIEEKLGTQQMNPEYVFYCHLMKKVPQSGETSVDKSVDKILGKE